MTVIGRITVLGGFGAVGRVAVRTPKELLDFDEIVIADINTDAVELLAEELSEACTPFEVDALQLKPIQSAIQGSDVVLNCVGSFYRFSLSSLSAIFTEYVFEHNSNDQYHKEKRPARLSTSALLFLLAALF
ncbi:MAG: saccharopine dehydrogenase NADP-binding domain-containing protein [Promethearchaeota archaeon]